MKSKDPLNGEAICDGYGWIGCKSECLISLDQYNGLGCPECEGPVITDLPDEDDPDG